MKDVVLCFDIGGTSIKGAIVDRAGTIYHKESFLTSKSLDKNKQELELTKCVDSMKSKVQEDMNIVGLGIGSPGFSDKTTVLVGGGENIAGMFGIRFSDIGDKYGIPTKHDNDANVAALGEAVYGVGCGQDSTSALLITLGTGVGGGFVFDGKIFRGSKRYAGEIGHACVVPEGLQCNCGGRGCIEQYSSATGFINNAKRRLHKKSLYNSILTEELLERDSAKAIFDAAKKGDILSLDTIAECSHILGIFIGSVMNMLDLDLVMIGGGLCKDFDMIKPHIDRGLNEQGLMISVPLLKIIPASLGNDAGVLGCAALFFMNKFLK